MKRILVMVGAAALAFSMLTACGDDGGGVAGIGGGGDYCEQLKAAKDELGGAETGDLGSLDDAAETMQDLRDSAPDDLQDDWDVLVEGFEAIIKAFEDAGIDQEDLEAMEESGEMPADVDLEAMQEAMGELEALGSEEFETASDNISKHAKEECDVDLDAA